MGVCHDLNVIGFKDHVNVGGETYYSSYTIPISLFKLDSVYRLDIKKFWHTPW